jgi:hypothetical protein
MVDFRSANRIRKLVFLLCTSLAIAAYCSANIVSSKYFHRRAFGAGNTVGLGDDSKRILDGIKSPVEIFVLLERTREYANAIDGVRKDIRRLLSEYSTYTTANEFTAEIIDVADGQKKYAELCARFGILPPNSIVVCTNGRVKVLSVGELFRARNRKIVTFNGEGVISSAIGELTNGDDRVAYFTVGHGEYELDSVSPARGLSALRHLAKQKNCDLRPLNLCDSRAIPGDADFVVIAGARNNFLGFEKEILRDYVDNRDGKIVAALDVNSDAGLRDFFEDYGIHIGEDLLTPTGANCANYSDDMIIKRLAQHKINEKLIELCVAIVTGGAREVRRAPWFVEDGKFEVTELLQTDDSVAVGGNGDGTDRTGPYFVAAISERKKFNVAETTANAGKVLLIGNADIISNGKIGLLGNRIFWLGMSNYMTHGDALGQGDGVAVDNYRLALSKGELAKICLRALALPGSFLLLALIVALQRRK